MMLIENRLKDLVRKLSFFKEVKVIRLVGDFHSLIVHAHLGYIRAFWGLINSKLIKAKYFTNQRSKCTRFDLSEAWTNCIEEFAVYSL